MRFFGISDFAKWQRGYTLPIFDLCLQVSKINSFIILHQYVDDFEHLFCLEGSSEVTFLLATQVIQIMQSKFYFISYCSFCTCFWPFVKLERRGFSLIRDTELLFEELNPFFLAQTFRVSGFCIALVYSLAPDLQNKAQIIHVIQSAFQLVY